MLARASSTERVSALQSAGAKPRASARLVIALRTTPSSLGSLGTVRLRTAAGSMLGFHAALSLLAATLRLSRGMRGKVLIEAGSKFADTLLRVAVQSSDHC